MTDKQMEKVRRKAYKYYDEVIYENPNWSNRDIALSSFYAGAEYVLKNKHELQTTTCLAEFLVRKGILIEFIANVCKSRSELSIDVIKCALNGDICSAFSWGGTPQGFDYWANISREYAKSI